MAADESLYLVVPIAWLGWLQPFLLLSFMGAPLAVKRARAMAAAALWW